MRKLLSLVLRIEKANKLAASRSVVTENWRSDATFLKDWNVSLGYWGIYGILVSTSGSLFTSNQLFYSRLLLFFKSLLQCEYLSSKNKSINVHKLASFKDKFVQSYFWNSIITSLRKIIPWAYLHGAHLHRC